MSTGHGHEPLGTVGILGAGQLAMMLSAAAADIGVRTVVFAPEQALSRPVGDRLVTGELDDVTALAAFADQVDVITFETENIPIEPVLAVADRALIRPTAEAVRIAQDRLVEKQFVNSLGLRTAPFAPIGDEGDHSVDRPNGPGIVKTRRFGYDGKGQVRIDGPDQIDQAWAELGRVPCIVEGFVDFVAEISVVAARGVDGTFVPFDPGTNDHRDGVLVRTTVPTSVPTEAAAEAIDATRRILDALDYVGVAGIEFFVTEGSGGSGEGSVMINEIAPRVHNSGHWTQLGCAVSQFEQHIRAITNRPLSDGARHTDVEMTNLLGHDVERLPELLAAPTSSIVLYGKDDVRPGRKMGHVNRIINR
jgi:5-(carboxyamino)imidazole ribonucleotide synthase